jgi:hypothetical protein
MAILDATVQQLKNSDWTETAHIEYQVINEKRELIADSTRREEGNFKQFGLPSETLVGLHVHGFIEETHVRRGISVITAYAQVSIAHTDPAQHWGILIRIDLNDILAPFRSFLWELSVLAILILLPLLGLVLGLIKTLHEEWSSTKREFQRAGCPQLGYQSIVAGGNSILLPVMARRCNVCTLATWTLAFGLVGNPAWMIPGSTPRSCSFCTFTMPT